MANKLDFDINFDSKNIDKGTKALKDLAKGAKAASANSSALSNTLGKLEGAVKKLESAKGRLNSVLTNNQMIFGGLTLSIGGMMSKAFDLVKMVQGWRNEFAVLSNSMGDTSEAMGLWMGAVSQSLGGMEKLKSSMFGLSAAGVQVGKSMQQLAIFTTDMHMAAGISQDKLIGLTGNMHAYWNVSVKGAKNVVSSVIAMQKAFGTTTQQMEMMLGTVQEVHDKTAAFFKDGEKSSVALTKGLSMVGGAMTKLGVNAQTANQFLTKMMDPDQFEETNTLMRMMNISYKEQIDMMSSATGKEQFFDKMLQNLPKISRQIQAIRDPFARMKFAKAIGLPPEIAAKMANARTGQLNGIIADYKKQADESKAAEEKRRKAAADRAKFEDTQLLFQMKVLAPMMDFVMKLWGKFMTIMPRLGTLLQAVVAKVVNFLDQILRVFEPAIELFAKGAPLDEILKSIDLKSIAETIFSIISEAAVIAGRLLIQTFMAAPWWGKLILLYKVIPFLTGIGKNISAGLQVARGTKDFLKQLLTKKAVSAGIPDAGMSKAFAPGLDMFDIGGKKGAGGLSKIFGKMGGVLSKGLKFLGPIGAIMGAGAGVLSGFGKEKTAERFGTADQSKVTTGERLASAATGAIDAVTFGLLPKGVTDSLAETFMDVADGFNENALSSTEKNELKILNMKKKFGDQLTADEQKRFDELNKKKEQEFKASGDLFTRMVRGWYTPFIFLGKFIQNTLSKYFGITIAKIQIALGKLINSVILSFAQTKIGAAFFKKDEITTMTQQQETYDKLSNLVQRASSATTSAKMAQLQKEAGGYGDFAAAKTISKYLTHQYQSAKEQEVAAAEQRRLQQEANKKLGGIGGSVKSIDSKTKVPEGPKSAGDFLAAILNQGSAMKLSIT